MGSKWKTATALCLAMCLLTACSSSKNADTPTNSKDKSSEIPLSYYPSVNGCLLTLEEGAYCIELRCNSDDAPSEQTRYFVVDGEHSYYHIHFTAKVS